jgi:murein DD-endopeptidase MepM/ murein hydrolase activator NlpD
MTPQQYFAQYPRSALGLSKTPSPGLIKAVFSGPASASLATTISLTVGGTLMTFMVIQAAFLANFPYTGVTAEDPMSRESRYIKIEKTAHTDCHSNHPDPNTCPNPQFPIQAEYKLKISPKENYTVTITTLSDQLVVDHNQKHYREELGQEPPEIAKRTKSLQDFELSQNDLTINPGESLVITYQEELSEDYNHALVRNKAKVEFNYSGSDGAGQDYATSYEVIRLGEYPEGLSCWPASGTITQLPYENAPSHEVLDAYDIAAPIGTPIFAPFDGELCPGHIDSNYGVHSTLKTSINNETYVLLFGHLAEGSSIVSHACQQVSAGDVIGFMDDTGWSTGSHLHYELRAGYDNTYTLTELVPGGQSGEPISKQMYVTSCYEEGYQ